MSLKIVNQKISFLNLFLILKIAFSFKSFLLTPNLLFIFFVTNILFFFCAILKQIIIIIKKKFIYFFY